jgi:ectoine hydroxylase-related dioxygenase (phytanoyl-CoA dioxygenase family)
MRRIFCEPTRHEAVAKHYAAENGLAILTGVLGRAEVHRLRLAVCRAADGGPESRLADLVPGDQMFRDLLEHPIAMDIVTHLLGPKVRLSNASAEVTRPGPGAAGMRAEQGYVTPPWPAWPLAVSIIWAVDEITAENGAPRVMPHSVRYGHGPEWGLDYPEAEPIVCPAGSIIVMDGRIWHQDGLNKTADRVSMFAHYVRPFILPRIEWRERVPPELRETLTPGLREMLGFGARATMDPRTRYGRPIGTQDPGDTA